MPLDSFLTTLLQNFFLQPHEYVQRLANGIVIGSVYAIFALGYTLIFSILRVINFAHGAIFMLGAYFTYALIGSRFGINGLLAGAQLPFSIPFPIAILIGAGLAGLIGVFVERVAFRPLRNKGADPLLTLVSSLGVSVAIINIVQYFFGAENYNFPSTAIAPICRPNDATFPCLPIKVDLVMESGIVVLLTNRIVLFVVSIFVMIGLTYLINRTKIGKALRAVAEDGTTASLLGIQTDRLILFTFLLSGFLGGIAGTLVGLNFGFRPYFGIDYGLKGLAVIVLGGLGDIPGAVVGGFVIGLAEAFVPADSVAYRDAVAFALLFIILLVRPQGLLGRAVVQKV
jgi:branched-chain amino acid transport system permease protein